MPTSHTQPMSTIQCVAIAAVLTTGGCTLIDQRTFNPDAGRAPVVVAPPAPLTVAPADPRALFTLRPPALFDADAARGLTGVVRTVLQRRPQARFVILSIVTAGPPATDQAVAIARAVIATGVPPARVAMRAETGSPAETRILIE